jgi:hypothetical protein
MSQNTRNGLIKTSQDKQLEKQFARIQSLDIFFLQNNSN